MSEVIRRMVFFVAAFTIFRAAGARALTTNITTAVGVGADAYITGGSNVEKNYGVSSTVLVKGQATSLSSSRKTYLRFDFRGMGHAPTAAVLKMRISGRTGTGTVYVYGLATGHSGMLWSEGANETGVTGSTPPNPITWNNAPGNTIASADAFTADATLLGSFPVTSANTVGSDIVFSSEALDAFIADPRTGGVVTLILGGTITNKDPGDGSISFHSKQNTGGHPAPTLQLDLDLNLRILRPNADAYTQYGTGATNNYGHWTGLLLVGSGTPRKSYLRFDLSDVPMEWRSEPALNLVFNSSTFTNTVTINVYGLDDGDAGEAWVEGTGETAVSGATPPNPITWNNAPANDTASGVSMLANATLIGGFSVPASPAAKTVYTFSGAPLGRFLRGDSTGATTIALTVTAVDNRNLSFHSKEGNMPAWLEFRPPKGSLIVIR